MAQAGWLTTTELVLVGSIWQSACLWRGSVQCSGAIDSRPKAAADRILSLQRHPTTITLIKCWASVTGPGEMMGYQGASKGTSFHDDATNSMVRTPAEQQLIPSHCWYQVSTRTLGSQPSNNVESTAMTSILRRPVWRPYNPLATLHNT